MVQVASCFSRAVAFFPEGTSTLNRICTLTTRQLTVRRKRAQTAGMKQVATDTARGIRAKAPATEAWPAKSSFRQSGARPSSQQNHED